MKFIDYKKETQKQWNTTPCGSIGETKADLDYFLKIEEDRYNEQDWMKNIFFNEDLSGKKILEIGFGQGTDLIQFAKKGAECFGIDLTQKHCNLAKSNFKLRGGGGYKAHLVMADASKLPFKNNFFDIIYSFGVLHHTPDIDKCLEEAFRVLKDNGSIIITIYHRYSAFYLFSKLLADGFIKLWILKLGIKGLRSTIEFGADGKIIKPLVILYTKRKIKKIMKNFHIKSIYIKHLKRNHFWKFGFILPNFIIKKLERFFGWYIIIKAEKQGK